MSNRTKSQQRRASDPPPGMLPKSERRALGKQAALKRARAKRRKKFLNNLATVGVALGVVVVIAAAFGAFSGDDGGANPEASASPTATGGFQTPEGADPALEVEPVVTAGTGDVTELKVTTIVEGKGPKVEAGQTITVNYVGVDYATGVEFDSSWKRGTSAEFPIGTGQVIKGWDQGLVGVTVGSRVQLDIPADLAYGEDATNGPAGDLRFVVDILAAKGAPAASASAQP